MRAEERPSTEERLSRIKGASPHLATKADVAALRAEMQAGFAEARAERAESEARVTRIIAEAQARNTRWLLAIGGLIIATVTLIDRLLG